MKYLATKKGPDKSKQVSDNTQICIFERIWREVQDRSSSQSVKKKKKNTHVVLIEKKWVWENISI